MTDGVLLGHIFLQGKLLHVPKTIIILQFTNIIIAYLFKYAFKGLICHSILKYLRADILEIN